MGVDVIVFLTIFSFTSFCLISFVRLFSSSFISLVFLDVGGVMAESLLLLPLDAAAADLRVLTVAEEDVDWMTVVVVVVVLLLPAD